MLNENLLHRVRDLGRLQFFLSGIDCILKCSYNFPTLKRAWDTSHYPVSPIKRLNSSKSAILVFKCCNQKSQQPNIDMIPFYIFWLFGTGVSNCFAGNKYCSTSRVSLFVLSEDRSCRCTVQRLEVSPYIDIELIFIPRVRYPWIIRPSWMSPHPVALINRFYQT